jgi:hypothetical protein
MSTFAQERVRPGVTLATQFATDAEVAPFKFAGSMDPAGLARVTRTAGGLRIATPKDAASTSPAWFQRLNPAWTKDTDGFGTTEFWVQLGLRIPASRLIPWKAGLGDWKFAIIANKSLTNPLGAPNQSSNLISHVLTNKNFGSRNWPTAYAHNNNYPNGQPFETGLPAPAPYYEKNLLPGFDRGASIPDYRDRYCCYPDARGCPIWAADKLVRFMARIHVRTYGGTAGNEFDLLMAVEGDTKWTTLISARNYLAGSLTPQWPNGFNGIWLTTFETNRAGSGVVDTYVEYRDLIVSTAEIPLLNDAPTFPPPETNMPAPTAAELVTSGEAHMNLLYANAGQPSLTQQLADAQAALTAANAATAAANTKLTQALTLVDQAIAADTVADQQEAARLAALRAQIA